jgi:hypothetical protein
MRKSLGLVALACLMVVDAGIALAQPRGPLQRVGQCATTRITDIGYRLVGENGRPIRDSGSAFTLANGLGGVGYTRVAALHRSRVGDRARICLVSIPRGCPPGDDRGRMYRTTNLRTRQSWTMSDSAHGCGGA